MLVRLVEEYQNAFRKWLEKTHLDKNCWRKAKKKTYKKIKDSNNKTGNSISKWEFFNAMDNMLGKKTEVEPVAVCNSTTRKKVREGIL